MEINEELAELIGVFIGDGFIGRYGTLRNSYHVEFSGSLEYEKDYYEFLSSIIKKHFEVKPRFRTIGGTIRMIIAYKQLYEFFRDLGFRDGIKNNNVSIPEKVYKSDILNLVIKGIFDSDGFFFLDKRKIYRKPYPRMGFSTKSEKLFFQVKRLFLKSGYKFYTRIDKRACVYHLEIYGKEQIKRWLYEYGITNYKKRNFASVAQSVGIPWEPTFPAKSVRSLASAKPW